MTTPYHALRGVSTKDWSFDDIVASSDNFHPVKRVRYDSDLTLALDEYKKSDIPLIIEGWHVSDAWNHELLSLNWFAKHAGLPGDSACPFVCCIRHPHVALYRDRCTECSYMDGR